MARVAVVAVATGSFPAGVGAGQLRVDERVAMRRSRELAARLTANRARVGGVTEDAVRGDDYEVVDGPSFGVGTLVGVLLAIATLGGAYLTVEKLQQGPVAPREGAVRMPATDRS